MAGIDVSKISKCVTIEQAPSQGSDGPKNKPNIDGGVKTKPPVKDPFHHQGGDEMHRGSGSAGQRLLPNGNSNSSHGPGKPGIKPPAHGGVPTGKPGIFVKPCPPATIEI